MGKVVARLTGAAALAAAWLAIPVTYTEGDGLGLNEAACFTGTCCWETKSKCYPGDGIVETNHYYLSSGKCNPN